MKIIFDDSWRGLGGIGRFASSILARLRDNECLVFSYANPASLKTSLQLAVNSLFQGKNNILFLPGYIPPLFSSIPFVFTIHDLNHIDRSENSSFLKRLFYNFIIKAGCHRAKYVLTVSEFSRMRIIEWSGILPDKVINVGNGVDDSFNMNVLPYQPGYPYLLCVSNRKLHKNEPRIIRAFSSANISASTKLLLTGCPTQELSVLIKQCKLSERVIFIGKVSDEELPSLYKGALCLVFPSLYEGFGLPVVEAMACGTPVITSTITSLPEVAGDAAILIDPNSDSELRLAIEKIVADDQLRLVLSVKGIEQAQKFRWCNVAEKIKKVLGSIK